MKIRILTLPILACLTLISIWSCGKDEPAVDQRQQIRDYIADKGLQADSTASGLFYVIEVPGNNEHPTLSDEIRIAYTGRFLNGEIFDANPSFQYPLNGLIAGWKEGIPLFGKGGKGILIVPSNLGYGSQDYAGIPGNSVLVFDIELFDF
jgi:FKBP-type peptidyl-prolyl cis-trans isomerase FkpA